MNCVVCNKRAYSNYCVQHKPRKPIKVNKPLPRPTKRIRQVSTKQAQYHVWLEAEARPYLIARDGNKCSCCKRPAASNEKLDIEHTIGKGAHPETKRDLNQMTLMCRLPCHHNKTDGIPCYH